jgi:hypothetical protein
VTIIVPVKPRGVMPTTVNARPFTLIVDPTRSGLRPVRCQYAWLATATGMSCPGRSSSAVKPRPCTTGTPITSK